MVLLIDSSLPILISALIVDWVIGDPDCIWKRISHPVVLFGKLIETADRRLNCTSYSKGRRRLFGILLIFLLVAIAVLIGLIVTAVFSGSVYGHLAIIIIASIFISQKSMYKHVHTVLSALQSKNISEGRIAVSKIVGRDTSQLEETELVRASIESLSENFSDGVVAPAFWFLIFGLPGLIAYKIINTADSMIGHKNEKYCDFGWASARLDDLVNFVPSRISGLLVSICAPVVGGSFRKSIQTQISDAKLHNSPNAGWPESAMAGVLDVALAGPRVYHTHKVEGQWINVNGRKELNVRDLSNSIRIFVAATIAQILFLSVAFLLAEFQIF